ncbi:MAG TPA: hypothetical protein IGS52_16305 [Oscillatoriaceae cyanobacterium M33_DOE_052]|nr:hypothetical protein [Oscillatoriaceae cyanobacterium M33_DOE_052]
MSKNIATIALSPRGAISLTAWLRLPRAGPRNRVSALNLRIVAKIGAATPGTLAQGAIA